MTAGLLLSAKEIKKAIGKAGAVLTDIYETCEMCGCRGKTEECDVLA